MAYQQFITSDGEDLVDSDAQDFYSSPVTHILYAPGLACGYPAISIPNISQIHGLSYQDIDMDNPVVAVTTEPFVSADGEIFADSDGNEFRIFLDESTAPDISQCHNLAVSDVCTSEPQISSPQIFQNHGLGMSDILTSYPAISIPNISQIHGLSYQSILLGDALVSTCVITQLHMLSATDIVSGIPNISMSILYVSDVFSGGGNRVIAVLK